MSNSLKKLSVSILFKDSFKLRKLFVRIFAKPKLLCNVQSAKFPFCPILPTLLTF